MKITQLSIFLENKPGHLSSACNILADANINILTLSLADTEQFGILRLIVKDWEKAKKILEENNFVVKVTEVIATEVEDKPGGLQKILTIFDGAETNIEYMYAFTFRNDDAATLIFRFDNADTAIKLLQDNNVNVIDKITLFSNLS